MLESGHLILAGDIGKFWEGVDFFYQVWEGLIFFRPWMGGLIFFHTLLANIFNKCHKRAIFMKNYWIWGKQIWARMGIELQAWVGGGVFYMQEGGNENLFWVTNQIFPTPTHQISRCLATIFNRIKINNSFLHLYLIFVSLLFLIYYSWYRSWCRSLDF